jgi:hypothetical protein
VPPQRPRSLPSRLIRAALLGIEAVPRPERWEQCRDVGLCRGCGAGTQPRNGKGDAYAYSKSCHPGAIERRWTTGRVLDAMREWREFCDGLPSSYDWSRTHARTHARRSGGEPLERLTERKWLPASVVTRPVRDVGRCAGALIRAGRTGSTGGGSCRVLGPSAPC